MAVEISKETVTGAGLYNGHTVVGTTPTQLIGDKLPTLKGVIVRCPGSADPVPNTLCVWIGRKGVTADSAPGTGGMPIPPGQGLFLPVDDPSQIYVISTGTGQEVAWMGV